MRFWSWLNHHYDLCSRSTCLKHLVATFFLCLGAVQIMIKSWWLVFKIYLCANSYHTSFISCVDVVLIKSRWLVAKLCMVGKMLRVEMSLKTGRNIWIGSKEEMHLCKQHQRIQSQMPHIHTNITRVANDISCYAYMTNPTKQQIIDILSSPLTSPKLKPGIKMQGCRIAITSENEWGSAILKFRK